MGFIEGGIMFKEKLEKIVCKAIDDYCIECVSANKECPVVNKILSLLADEFPEEEHSKECLYVIEPRYFGNPAKERYCNCGAFDNNYALKEVKDKLGI